MLLEEPLLKLGVGKPMFIQSSSLEITTDVRLHATLNLSDTIQRSFYMRGFPDFTFELLRFCDKKTCFFDIGANVGLISCAASRWIPPEQVHCFEPIPANFDLLLKNISLNCPGVFAHRLALSDRSGHFEMVTCSHDSGAASLETTYRVNRLAKLGYPTELRNTQVRTVSFDSFVNEKRFEFQRFKKVAIKIDVEGHELPVLRGMGEFLEKNRSLLEMLFVIEVHRQNFEEIQRIFASWAFQRIWPEDAEIASFHERKGAAIDLIFHRAVAQPC